MTRFIDLSRKEQLSVRSEYMKKYTSDLRKLVLSILGDKCIKCGFDDYRALQVDHVNGGGIKEMRESGIRGGSAVYWRNVIKSIKIDERKYQLLCANCNWIKRFINKEVRNNK